MTSTSLRAIPTTDRAWLLAGLSDALAGGAPVLPVPEDADTGVVDALLGEALPEGTGVVIRTSGSSGIPKAVALSAEALRASAEATHEALGGPGQWLVALPAHLISGLQMLVRSAVSGIEPMFFDGGFDPAALLESAEQMEDQRCYVSLVPVQFARLLDLAEQDRDAAEILRRFDAVLVGGQSVPLELRSRAHALGVQLRRSYGMTETAGGCVYDGVETGDTRMRIRDGEVQLAGPQLALGYVGDPELTRDRFVVDGDVLWYRTGDAGEMLGGMLTVTGRLDRVIVSGGINVSLDEIERVVAEQPGWSDTVALAVDDAEWGQRSSLVRPSATDPAPVNVDTAGLAVDPVADPDVADPAAVAADTAAPVSSSFDEVRAAVRQRLGVAATPVWATEIDEIPRLPGGKPDRRALYTWIGMLRDSFRETGAAGTAPPAAPSDFKRQ